MSSRYFPIHSPCCSSILTCQDVRRQLEQSQKQLDTLQARYSAQAKTKEPSALREDAFQLFEARRAYLKASMDFSTAAPQLRMCLDKVIVRIFYDQWRDMRDSREKSSPSTLRWNADLERVRGWSREMENGERMFRKELQQARKQIEETAEAAARPSRELEDYSANTATATGSRGPTANSVPSKQKPAKSEKQGWLFLKSISGKPARTVWLRRWFYVKNGIFGWLVQGSRSGGVEESERIGVLLCGVRPSPSEERRFCFEVKTKDTTIVLQADSQPEMADWMTTFDIAKQKALEDPSSTDSPVTTAPRALDPAFAISPPSAPEFAASAADAGMQQSLDDSSAVIIDRSSTLPIPGADGGGVINRSSFDVGVNRRGSTMEREGESGRDQAARIMQKLDLHRKVAVGSQVSAGSPSLGSFPSSQSTAGGIASLIAASHMTLPVGPSALPPTQPPEVPGVRIANTIRNLPSSTLAPSTLANPPTATNLSATAVIVNGERGIGVGRTDTTGGMPSGIMANLWGSSNWGYINRLERGEVKAVKDPARFALSSQSSFTQSSEFPTRDPAAMGGEQQRHSSLIDKEKAAASIRGPSPGHRKTISLGGDAADLQRSIIAPQAFPSQYPIQLKAQEAQFRLLFPNVKQEEKLVLVFQATWNPNDQQEFPGRVYVTAKDIYFYSHHLGLVLITGLSLSSVSEVTAAPGRDCDFLFLHLKQTSDKVDFTRITVKTFLEPLKLLQRRLNFLVQNCNSDEPYNLEGIMKALIKLEHEEDVKSPSLESWEDGSATPVEAVIRNRSPRVGRDLRANVLIDQGLFGQGKRFGEKEPTRFKLPGQPVVYVPRGITNLAVEKQYDISPKALFHVMFGDRSAVWQLLYHERRAQSIKQGPWTQQEQNHLRRTFEYKVEYKNFLRQNYNAVIVDNQMIDVLNDHLCYVVTDRKTPWHLPYQQYYTLVSKIVITHVAKSKCKLAIYTKVDWANTPVFVRGLVERKALSDLELDALDLADVITDQVRKLGAHSRTKKAVQIFGQIGQLTQTTEFGPTTDPKVSSQGRRSMGRRTLAHLIFEAAWALIEGIVTSIMMWTVEILKWLWKTGNANSIILFFLASSVLTNLFFTSRETSEWRKERNAGKYMTRLGIGPDMVMSKAVHVLDLDSATQVNSTISGDTSGAWWVNHVLNTDHKTNPCNSYQTFHAVTSSPDPHLSNPTSRRIHRTRERLGGYRHDLLVAMRVVNSIEREMMQAEWEDWIAGETGKCAQMRKMLERGNSTPETETRSRFEEYCASCREAQSQVLVQRKALT